MSFAPHNLDKSIDSLWLFNEENFRAKYKVYFPIISNSYLNEYRQIAGFSSFIKISLLGDIFHQSIYSLERQLLIKKFPYLGGFDPNKNKFNLALKKTNGTTRNQEISLTQLNYLNRIISLCKEKGIIIYLVNTPLFFGGNLNNLKYLDTNYCKVLDFGDMFVYNVSYFADYVHLNTVGAKKFTEQLEKEIR